MPSDNSRALAAQTPRRPTPARNKYKPSIPQVLTILAVGAPREQTAAALARLFKTNNTNAMLFALKAAKWQPGDSAPLAHGNGRPVRYNNPANTVRNVDRMAAAAYIHGAAIRAIERPPSTSGQIRAIQDERDYSDMHASAQQERRDAAQRLAIAQKAYGNTLGWYTRGDADVETRCARLAWHNFRTDRPLPVGYPGAIHPNCRCWAGPPFTQGALLN